MTQTEMQDLTIAKATEDGEFRARLLADPKAAIRELTGEAIPDGIEVQVHQETAASFHLVLPPSGRLMEEEMSQLVGGIGSGGGSADGPDAGPGPTPDPDALGNI